MFFVHCMYPNRVRKKLLLLHAFSNFWKRFMKFFICVKALLGLGDTWNKKYGAEYFFTFFADQLNFRIITIWMKQHRISICSFGYYSKEHQTHIPQFLNTYNALYCHFIACEMLWKKQFNFYSLVLSAWSNSLITKFVLAYTGN